MNKKNNFLLFLIGITFFSCESAKNPLDFISNIDTDFPITEKLEFKLFNKYDILTDEYCMIDDSVLWNFFGNGERSVVGYCYDLNTGKQLSTIAMKGNAANEFTSVYFFHNKMMGDSIQLDTHISGRFGLKTFAKKDIIENKPMNERGFSVVTAPETIKAGRMIKLPNGSLLVTIRGTQGESPQPKESDINYKSIAIFTGDEVKTYETIDYDSFDLKMTSRELEQNEPKYMIKNDYASADIEIKGNDVAAFSVLYQFILYTLDLNSGNVIKEKRYTNMVSSGVSHYTTNDMEMRMGLMESNDKYIFCPVSGYFSKEDKELKLKKRALFVFDWDLNPIKRFELPSEKGSFYIISTDCSSIYLGVSSEEEGLILSKADLKI